MKMVVNYIDSGEQRTLSKTVAIKVYQKLEQNNNINKALLFAAIYRGLKNKFNVASYRDIQKDQFRQALDFIRNWI